MSVTTATHATCGRGRAAIPRPLGSGGYTRFHAHQHTPHGSQSNAPQLASGAQATRHSHHTLYVNPPTPFRRIPPARRDDRACGQHSHSQALRVPVRVAAAVTCGARLEREPVEQSASSCHGAKRAGMDSGYLRRSTQTTWRARLPSRRPPSSSRRLRRRWCAAWRELHAWPRGRQRHPPVG